MKGVSLLRAVMFLVPLLAAAWVRWWLARREVRPAHRWLLWMPIAGSAIVAIKSQLPPRRRAAALVGGSAATYLALAVLALAVFLTVGQDTGRRYYVIDAVTRGAPAEGRLAAGDRLLEADGETLWFGEGPPLPARINDAGGRPMSFTVERDGREQVAEVAARQDERGDYRIGVELRYMSVFERPSLGRALADAAVAPAVVSSRFLAAWWDDMTGDHDDIILAGPVGIADTLNKLTDSRESLAMTLAVSVWFLTWTVLADLVLLLVVGFSAARRRGASAAR